MNVQSVTLDSAQSIEVRQAGGDLAIQGWDKPEVEARGDGVRIEQGEGSVRVSSRGDLLLAIPRSARLEVITVGGDARIENLDEAVSLSVIGGDAVLRNLTGPVSLNGPVGGDTRFENVAQVSVAGGLFSRHSQRGAEQGERIAGRHQRRAEERLRHAEKKMERVRARTGVDFGSWLGPRRAGPAAGDQVNERVSEEERIAILKMLQEKKITTAQADKLLAALEGEFEGPQAGASPPDEAGR